MVVIGRLYFTLSLLALAQGCHPPTITLEGPLPPDPDTAAIVVSERGARTVFAFGAAVRGVFVILGDEETAQYRKFATSRATSRAKTQVAFCKNPHIPVQLRTRCQRWCVDYSSGCLPTEALFELNALLQESRVAQ